MRFYNIDIHKQHRKHRNVLYILTFLLLVFQIITFVFMSGQFSELNSKINSETERVKMVEKNLTKYFNDVIEDYNVDYQKNFNDISLAIATQAEQQKSFEEKIELIQTSPSDFSAVVEDAVKAVVSVLTERSMGSGFLITEEGFLITNEHVVENAERIRVLTYDKKIIPAEVIGLDKLRDIALLKIEGKYDYLKLADSDELRVGRKVVAIGNPLGLSFTVTEGIISALDREGPNGIAEYVQTDVSLNPGNSGGPLINTEGEVVGINNFKVGGAESLGFALESNAIKKSINAMLNNPIIT